MASSVNGAVGVMDFMHRGTKKHQRLILPILPLASVALYNQRGQLYEDQVRADILLSTHSAVRKRLVSGQTPGDHRKTGVFPQSLRLHTYRLQRLPPQFSVAKK